MNLDFTVLNLQADYEKCLMQYPFRFFFSLDGSARSPASLTFNKHKDIPDYILSLVDSFSEAFLIFTRECGFKSPVEEGIFHEKGARYIDVLLDNIPQQRGLVSAELIDQGDLFEEEDFLIGQSIRIVVDRNLILGTGTPIHELFHVFQYNYCHFNNMWFMEGLARWAQNLTHSRPGKVEILPQDRQQLQALFRRAHDAEYFWRRLLSFVEQPVEFVRKLLLECEFQCRVIELKSANSKAHQKNAWTREEKRSRHNNIIIAKALIHIAKNTVVNELPELVNFIQSLEIYSSESSSELTVKGDIELKTVADLIQFQHIEEVQGNLTISVSDLCSLGGFNQLEVVAGTLLITECSSLEEIVGFNQLRKINSLEISFNTELVRIDGFNSLFLDGGYISGFVKVINNKKLNSVSFLYGVQETKSSFYLHHNNLLDLGGLEKLKKVGASLSLSSNQLSDINALSNLESVNGMLGIAFNRLVSLKGLDRLNKVGNVKWGDEYRSLAIHGNKYLKDISSIGLLKSSTGYLVINIDHNSDFEFLPDSRCDIYNQDVKVISSGKELDVTSVFPLYNKNKSPVFVFDDKWINALSQHKWMRSEFFPFNSVDKLIPNLYRVGAEYIYAQVARSQYFLIENNEVLHNAGLKFLFNSKPFMDLCFNKSKFYEFMVNNGFSSYVPAIYDGKNGIEFPVVYKIDKGGNGENVFIVNNMVELESIDGGEGYSLTECVLGKAEYASNFIYSKGEILFEITYKREFSDDLFVLRSASYNDNMISLDVCENKLVDIFRQIMDSFEEEFLVCCFDYKVVNGVPKIFEINTRLGYTLIKDSKNFKKAIDVYCQLADKHALSS
ncbi:hypothetical protein [Oceanospirillum sediminis]|uniref:ATP-grasp domain-containing protein n=1 Tax=Oceanospirillum sediminis TaxID=2760088 RepID=A0A839IXZ7_9GAMM|nr:hypothetical protein [Oceanospirillum sediminis]MBB1488956.1 hypothetical protein [Oceanospirillum sediminis]